MVFGALGAFGRVLLLSAPKVSSPVLLVTRSGTVCLYPWPALQHVVSKWPMYVFLLSGMTCLLFR